MRKYKTVKFGHDSILGGSLNPDVLRESEVEWAQLGYGKAPKAV